MTDLVKDILFDLLAEQKVSPMKKQLPETKLAIMEAIAGHREAGLVNRLLGAIEHIDKKSMGFMLDILSDWKIKYILMKLWIIVNSVKVVEEWSKNAKIPIVKMYLPMMQEMDTAALFALIDVLDGLTFLRHAPAAGSLEVGVKSVWVQEKFTSGEKETSL